MYNSSSTQSCLEQAGTFTTCTMDGDDDDENHLLCGTSVWMCSNDNSCIADAFCVHVRLTEAIGHQEMLATSERLRAQTGPVPHVRDQLVANCL